MAANFSQGFPGVPQGTMVQPDGSPTPIWLQFFLNLYARTGSASGSPSPALDQITSMIGSLLYRGNVAWSGLNPGAQDYVLRMGAHFPEWDLLDGNSFGPEPATSFFAGPVAGAPAIPVFRAVASTDLPPGEYPGTTTNDNAVPGNVGEEIESTIASGGAVALATGIAADITSIALTAGDWDVWGNIATTAAPISANGWINTSSATDPSAPNGGAYASWAASNPCVPVGMRRLKVPPAGSIAYLSTKQTFAGSVSAYGFLGARRRR